VSKKTKREKMKQDLAAFIQDRVDRYSIDDNAVYEELKRQWRECYKGERDAPSQRSILESLGAQQATVSRMMAKLARSGRVLVHGSHNLRVYVPNEKEFTG